MHKLDNRDLAVRLVDQAKGYTMEFAPHPGSHRELYDVTEESIKALTRRQREALLWLERVGKASAKTIRRHGFAVRTLDALADRQLVKRDYVRSVGPFPSFPVYRSYLR